MLHRYRNAHLHNPAPVPLPEPAVKKPQTLMDLANAAYERDRQRSQHPYAPALSELGAHLTEARPVSQKVNP
jgi:hypothetical protein